MSLDDSSPAKLSDVIKALPKESAVLAWIVMTALALVVAFLASIPITGVTALHPPYVVLPLLLTIPLIHYLTKGMGQKEYSGSSDGNDLLLFAFIAAAGIVCSNLFLDFSSLFIIAVLLVLPFLYAVVWKKCSFKTLGFTLGGNRNIYASVVVVIVYTILAALLFIPAELEASPSVQLVYIPLFALNSIPMLLFSAALPEEFIFRSLIQTNASHRWNHLRGILFASLVFGLLHFPVNIYYYGLFFTDPSIILSGALLMSVLHQSQVGLITGYAWCRTKSLVMPIGIHLMHDVVEFAVYLTLMSTIAL